MTPLRRRMIEDMKLKNLSTRTINTYVSRVSKFAQHFGRSPQYLGRNDVRSYLLHLIREKKVSWSVYNQTLAALRYLYEVTLGRKDVLERIPFPKQPRDGKTVREAERGRGRRKGVGSRFLTLPLLRAAIVAGHEPNNGS